MVWFKVDDGWHSHPKRIKSGVDLEGLAAQGLWAAAGSWSAKNLTDGFVTSEVLEGLAFKTPWRVLKKLVDRLVRARLFEPAERDGESGWIYHDWDEWNPTRAEEQAKVAKKSMGGALGNHRRWHEGKGKIDPRCDYCPASSPGGTHVRSGEAVNGSHRPSDTDSEERSVYRSEERSLKRNGSDNGAIPPTRPDPTREVQNQEPLQAVASLTNQDRNGRHTEPEPPPRFDFGEPRGVTKPRSIWADENRAKKLREEQAARDDD